MEMEKEISLLKSFYEAERETSKKYMAKSGKLQADLKDTEIRYLKILEENKELKEEVRFLKQKYDMAIRMPTPTADLEEEIKQLKDKVVLWKKDAEKSKEEAQQFREQMIKEANMKEKYSNEFDVMQEFYEVEKDRAKKAESEYEQLKRDFKKEKENSEFFSEKYNKSQETIRFTSKEIEKLNEEVQKWKNAYSEEVQKPVAVSSANPQKPFMESAFMKSALKAAYNFNEVMEQQKAKEEPIFTGKLESTLEFTAPVYAVMKFNLDDPELFMNPAEAIERTEQMNKEKDAYQICTVRILKVK